MIFITKNYYLGGKNSARFIPQRGVAAKRYAQPLCVRKTVVASNFGFSLVPVLCR